MGNPAARVGDMHVCPKVEPGPVPHVGGPIEQGSPDVTIGGMPAARVGDRVICAGPLDEIVSGSSTVFINGKPAALMGDFCAHGGKIVSGCPTVIIGDGGGSGVPAAIALASAPQSHLSEPPKTKKEVMQRMAQATDKVKACREDNQPAPQSPYSTPDKLQIVEQGLNEKFIVRVIETQYSSDEGSGDTILNYFATLMLIAELSIVSPESLRIPLLSYPMTREHRYSFQKMSTGSQRQRNIVGVSTKIFLYPGLIGFRRGNERMH